MLCLYDHQLLTTDQLELLFFSSKRRAQDRLLFVYRHRLLDRFYPPSTFGAGKPQAHWLLDEAGAILVAAILGVERKHLGWTAAMTGPRTRNFGTGSSSPASSPT